MKLLLALFALVSFGIVVPNMYADDLTLNLAAIGGAAVDLGPVSDGTGVVTYDLAAVPLFQGNTLVGVYNLNFTATWIDAQANLPVGATWPAGAVDALVVTESCAALAVTIPPSFTDPCTGLSFAYTNLNAGNIVGVTGDVNIGADVNAQILSADVGLGIGAGTETIGFGNPPSATPEPGTLSLMGTGLLGIAGVLRRRFRA